MISNNGCAPYSEHHHHHDLQFEAPESPQKAIWTKPASEPLHILPFLRSTHMLGRLAPLVQASDDEHDDQQNRNGVTISDRFYSSVSLPDSGNHFMFNSLLNQ